MLGRQSHRQTVGKCWAVAKRWQTLANCLAKICEANENAKETLANPQQILAKGFGKRKQLSANYSYVWQLVCKSLAPCWQVLGRHRQTVGTCLVVAGKPFAAVIGNQTVGKCVAITGTGKSSPNNLASAGNQWQSQVNRVASGGKHWPRVWQGYVDLQGHV
jgi:hypothetical protein